MKKRKRRALTAEQKTRQATASLAWYYRNKESAKERRRAWYRHNKENLREKQRAYREQNREALAEKERARNKANPGASAKRSHSWYMRNKERKAQYGREYRAANKEQVRLTLRAWNDRNPYRVLVHGAKTRAKREDVPFDLTPTDVIIPERCPVFGIVLERGKQKVGPNSPTIDRIDPTKGYVRGNIAVISHYANTLKNNGTAAEHRRIAEWMESFK
jgi:hypothetical protein